MENRQRQLEIIKSLNDNRSKVSALYSLYNSSILTAEEDRTNIISLYEQMIDIKNSMNEISNRIYNVRKDERAEEYNKNKTAIKKMKTLWGSCSKHFNKITLNEYLLKADIRCIEYVVFHELTHLIYNAHNKDFYDFLTIYMPDWKERKKRLDLEVVQGL